MSGPAPQPGGAPESAGDPRRTPAQAPDPLSPAAGRADLRAAAQTPPGVDLSTWKASGWETAVDIADVKSPRIRAWITMALLGGAAIVWGLAILIVDLAAFDILEAIESGRLRLGEDEAFVERAENISRVSILLNVTIGVAFLAWLYRTTRNVPLLGGGDTRRTAGGAVGWWFVPIANLFVPYQIVADVDRRLAIVVGSAWTRWLVLAWWLCWTLGGVLARILGFTRTSETTTIQELRELFEIQLYADVLVFVAGLLLLRLVWRMQARQDARIERLHRPAEASAIPAVS